MVYIPIFSAVQEKTLWVVDKTLNFLNLNSLSGKIISYLVLLGLIYLGICAAKPFIKWAVLILTLIIGFQILMMG